MEAVRTAVVAADLPLILKDRNNAPDFPPPRLRDIPDPEALRPVSAMMWYQMTTTVWGRRALPPPRLRCREALTAATRQGL